MNFISRTAHALLVLGLILVTSLTGAAPASAVVDGDVVTDTPESGGDLYRFTGRLVDSAGGFRFALTAGGLVLDLALGASVRAPWFAAVYYPKLLLGHAAAAFWSDAPIHADGDAVEFRHGATFKLAPR